MKHVNSIHQEDKQITLKASQAQIMVEFKK